MIALTVIVLFSACKKDDDSSGANSPNPSVINAKNVVGNGEIVSVKALMKNYITGEKIVIATSKFEKNGFRMTLPTPPEACLNEAGAEFGGFISDLKAKVGFLDVAAFNEKDKKEGAMYFLGINASYYVDAYYVYSDRDFTIKGYYHYAEYDCSFKKGWNLLYYVENSVSLKDYYTTQKPAEVTLEWVFNDYFDYSYVRFVNEVAYYYDCIILGVTNNYYGTLAYKYFCYGAGESEYYKIPSGNHNIFHRDYYSSENFIDIENYYFDEDTYYSVICSENEDGELNFNIIEDEVDTKVNERSVIQLPKYSIAKRINEVRSKK